MNIGLTGGITSGKTAFEEEFGRLGYPVFETDKIAKALRSGLVAFDPSDDILRHQSLVERIEQLSIPVKENLRRELPLLYDSKGRFDREQLLKYVNDDRDGARNYTTKNSIVNPNIMELYQLWRELSGENSVVSNGVLIEQGYLSLIDILLMVRSDENTQIVNCLRRELQRGHDQPFSYGVKAVGRQLPFDKRLGIAVQALGQSNVYVVESPSTLPSLLLPILTT